jgi:hypothetical protein
MPRNGRSRPTAGSFIGMVLVLVIGSLSDSGRRRYGPPARDSGRSSDAHLPEATHRS